MSLTLDLAAGGWRSQSAILNYRPRNATYWIGLFFFSNFFRVGKLSPDTCGSRVDPDPPVRKKTEAKIERRSAFACGTSVLTNTVGKPNSVA